MTSTAPIAPQPDRLLALKRVNEIRRARAQLKRRIGGGHVSAAEVILDCPVEASRWPVAELLASQQHWGNAKCRKFLARNRISEAKPVGELTERQRQLLAGQLEQHSQAQGELGDPAVSWAGMMRAMRVRPSVAVTGACGHWARFGGALGRPTVSADPR